MATRSTIALEFADGTVQQVYCHWDGYLEYNGQILFKHWSDPFKLQKMIDLGDMSSLGKDVGEQHDFDERPVYDADNIPLQCTFYQRDRSESGTMSKKFKDFADYIDNHQYEEFEYILRNIGGKATWFVKDHNNSYQPLADALALVQAEAAA